MRLVREKLLTAAANNNLTLPVLLSTDRKERLKTLREDRLQRERGLCTNPYNYALLRFYS